MVPEQWLKKYPRANRKKDSSLKEQDSPLKTSFWLLVQDKTFTL